MTKTPLQKLTHESFIIETRTGKRRVISLVKANNIFNGVLTENQYLEELIQRNKYRENKFSSGNYSTMLDEQKMIIQIENRISKWEKILDYLKKDEPM